MKLGGKESMARDRTHRTEHARIFDAAAFELLEHHPLARIFEVNRHRGIIIQIRRASIKVSGEEYLGMPFFDSAGVKIHYVDVGTGEAVVLVHGFASTAEHNWGGTGWIATLSEKYRVIAPDVRGHGLSDHPHERARRTDTRAWART